MRGRLLIAGACLLTASAANADPPAPVSVPIRTAVPTLSVSGTTSGKGKASIGVDLLNSLSAEDWEWHLAPSFTVASTDGIANILSLKSGGTLSGAPDWGLGLSLTFLKQQTSAWDRTPEDLARLKGARAKCRDHAQTIEPAEDEKTFWLAHARWAANLVEEVPALREDARNKKLSGEELQRLAAMEKALPEIVKTAQQELTRRGLDATACTEQDPKGCDAAPLDQVMVHLAKDCTTKPSATCTWLSRAETRIGAAELCKSGQKMLGRESDARNENVRFPEYLFALGAFYGATQIKGLTGGTGPNANLTLTTETKSNIILGGLFTYVKPSDNVHFTFELPAIFKSTYKPQSTTAKWCYPSGTVTTKDGSGPAQVCDEQPLGAAQHVSQISGALLFGLTTDKGIFRFAAGPTMSYDLASTDSAAYQIGLQVPIYLSLVKDVAGYSGDYEGIIRVVPSFAINHTDKGNEPVGTVTLELLGKRGMFGSMLYWP